MRKKIFNEISRIIICWFCFALLVIISYACTDLEGKGTVPFYNTPDFTPVWSDQGNTGSHTIADFRFVNQNGDTVSKENLKGKIHVANFFFTTCPSVCPKMTVQFQELQKNFETDPDVVLMSYTVTPWKDSVERLKAYAANNNIIKDKWHLLTGKKSDIYSLARKSYFAEEETGYTKDSTEFLHTEHFILVDKNFRIRGIYNGTLPLETERLTADIKLLKEE